MNPYDQILEKYQEFELEQRFTDEPKSLYEPINYVLSLGGKKVRPMLTLLSTKANGARAELAHKLAYALELFHNFTLLHDDVMDHADQRRGRPTVHKKWNVATAILSGDEMLIRTCALINEVEMESGCNIMADFLTMASEVCQGQQSDMDFEQRDDVSLDEYTEMIRKKTAVLLAAAMKFGAGIAGASVETQNTIYQYGTAVGLGFQMMDDYLDTYGDESFGKRIGGDILEDKKTWLYIKTQELANPGQKAVLTNWHGSTDEEEAKIEAVRSIYSDLGVDAQIKKEMESHFRTADELASKLVQQGCDMDELTAYVNRLSRRSI